MLANRRRSERRVCRSFAKIQFGTGGLPRDCMITDVSDGGVKIIAEYPEIPLRIHHDLLDGPAPRAVQAGMADRLRIRRSVRRLGRTAVAIVRGAPECRLHADDPVVQAACDR